MPVYVDDHLTTSFNTSELEKDTSVMNDLKIILLTTANYVNVLEVNLELVKQYPDLYSEFLNTAQAQKITDIAMDVGG